VIVDVPHLVGGAGRQPDHREKNKVFSARAQAQRPDRKSLLAEHHHWTYDTYALAHTTAPPWCRPAATPGSSLTADYAFGQALERDTAAVVTASGRQVLGSVKHRSHHRLLLLPPAGAVLQGER